MTSEAMDSIIKGILLGEQGKLTEALNVFNKAIEIEPKDVNAWYNKSVTLSKLDRNEEALKAIDEAIKIIPNITIYWFEKGSILKKLRRYKEALNAYDKVIEIDPKDKKAWNNKGSCFYDLGMCQEALNAFDKVIEIYPKEAIAWYNMGYILNESGMYRDGLICLDKAIEIDPKNEKFWSEKARAYIKLGKGDASLYDLATKEEALKAYEKVIDINPKIATSWFNKGTLLLKVGMFKEALTALDKAIEIDPKSKESWHNKGISLYMMGRYEEALNAFNRESEIVPNDFIVKAILGELFLNVGNIEEASNKAEELLNIDEKNAHIFALVLQGKIKIEEQKYDDAIKVFKEAFSLNMDNRKLLLFELYSTYLNAEFFLKSNEKRYNEKIIEIIRRLERVEKLPEKKNENIRVYILYFLGYFYYKIGDFYTAKEKLEECTKIKDSFSIKPSPDDLLQNILNYKIKKSGISWWLNSSKYRWIKRIFFIIIIISILIMFFVHPFIPLWFPSLQLNWTLYVLFNIMLICILIFPFVESIKTEGVEIKMLPSLPNDFFLPPLIMGLEMDISVERNLEHMTKQSFKKI